MSSEKIESSVPKDFVFFLVILLLFKLIWGIIKSIKFLHNHQEIREGKCRLAKASYVKDIYPWNISEIYRKKP